jgi:hypothetical protein
MPVSSCYAKDYFMRANNEEEKKVLLLKRTIEV